MPVRQLSLYSQNEILGPLLGKTYYKLYFG